MKPTLLILAAGMGSRYGGLKQLDEIGPNGETIIDYSVFDAIRNGFGKVVFVVRKDFAKEFEDKILSKYINDIDVELVFQDVKNISDKYSINSNRTKPWGTGHAVLAAKDAINTPFAVINADDFYGCSAFRIMAENLIQNENKTNRYSMVGYIIDNTLSLSGGVSRGVCDVDENNILTNIVERSKIEKTKDSICYIDKDGLSVKIPSNTIVSMNFWGFTPDYFDYSEKLFDKFLKENENNLEAEFYIPTVVNSLIKNKEAKVEVLQTSAVWFGITYKEDKIQTIINIAELIQKGKYPGKIW